MMTLSDELAVEQQPMDEADCWRVVLERDGRCDGTFVYAVRSTGVYCRPSCASRRPRREQVRFFAQPAAAEAAGFRACKRCRPRQTDPPDSPAALVQRVCRYIDEHLDAALTLERLGAAVGVSPHHLQRTFKAALGITPRQYADARRVECLKTGLKEGQNVTEALYTAGYGSSSRLYERADEQLGMTPATYRRGGAGMTIGYALVDCVLGRLLVAATARGVCMVSLGDADAPLEEALAAEYPAATIRRDVEGLNEWVAAILRHLAGTQPHLDLPLDLQATAFQRRVWAALQAIPYGGTTTYSDLARDLGQPAATRAVARACATNPVSIVVPCHRVLGADGSLRGYRWGLERKQALLDHERAQATPQDG